MPKIALGLVAKEVQCVPMKPVLANPADEVREWTGVSRGEDRLKGARTRAGA